jgi:enoyl-CoA hydratase/carnithine racemase
MLESLAARIHDLRGRDDARVAVVRGEGGTFCAGADIADWVSPSTSEAAELSRLGRDTFTALAELPIPSVAVVEGTAVGGGLELALACDLRVAADDALVGFPETRLGNLPAWGGLSRLIEAAGLGVARHLLLTGELVDGRRAAGLLIVTESCPTEGLDAAVSQTVENLLAADFTALTLAKQVLSGFGSDLPLEPAMAALTAGLPSSRARKQDFLDRKARRRQGATT